MFKAVYLPSMANDSELPVYSYEESSNSFVANIKEAGFVGEELKTELVEDFVNVHAVMNDPDWIVNFVTEDGITYRIEKTHPMDDNLLGVLLQDDEE